MSLLARRTPFLLRPAPFRPTDVAGCRLWLAADRGVTVDGSNNVSQWADLSGNGNHVGQATASKQPDLTAGAVGGRPAVRFDGTDDVLINATAATWKFLHDGTGWTAFVVFETTSDNPDALLGLLGTQSFSSSETGVAIGHDDRSAETREDKIVVFVAKGSAGNPSANFLSADDAAPAGAATLLTVRYENGIAGNDLTAFVDGASIGGADTTNTPHASGDPSYGLHVGAFGNEAFPYAGDLAEVVLYNRALSAADRGRVGRYLAARYGVAYG